MIPPSLHGPVLNLFLAGIPVVLGWVLAWGMAVRGRQRRLPPVVTVPLLIVWLLFLPNTCYLLTEWRHLLRNATLDEVIGLRENQPHAMYTVARWSLFYLAYSGTGLLLFVLAIRPLEGWARACGKRPIVFAPLLFFLASLGVYLGLMLRWNSWDALRHPMNLWAVVARALATPSIIASIAVFALVLWAMYEAVDLWVDGAVGRMRAWGWVGPPPGKG